MSSAIAIIVAAGRGERAGPGLTKQVRLLLGKPVLAWSAEAFARHPDVARTLIVTSPADRDAVRAIAGPDAVIVLGGATRTASVLAALAAVEAPDDTPVLIHDAARPGLSQAVITRLLEALANADAAAPALRISDAVKDTSSCPPSALDRTPLRRVQTPQAFRLGHIRDALRAGHQDLVDDLAAMETPGARISLVEGDPRLDKLTYAEDFDRMARLLAPSLPAIRVGSGFDVHAFGEGDHITLCGLKIPHSHGLIGHSDADVAWHALTDAILGALAEGDIGDHFPPSDPQWKGASSDRFLRHAARLASLRGYEVSQVDMTVICEAPKVKPHRLAMRESTAALLGLPLDRVSLKATTTEGLGFAGRREGMAAQASAVLSALPALD